MAEILFFYLRLIKIMYFDKEKEKYDTDHGLWLKFSLTFSTLLILFYFIFPSQLIEVVSRINIIWWSLKFLNIKKLRVQTTQQ